MPRPGTTILIAEDAPPAGAVLDTGQAFFIGVAERGPESPQRVDGLRDYKRVFGERSGGQALYDAAYAFFAEGGTSLIVSRIVGESAEEATIDLGATDGLTATASSPGEWANGYTVEAVDAGGGQVAFIVSDPDDNEVERSYGVESSADAISWSATSDYVRFTPKGDGTLPPAATTGTLAGGTDSDTVDATTAAAALDRFDVALGPGQVCAPGLSDDVVHTALLDHINTTRRCALLDAPPAQTEAQLLDLATTIRAHEASRYAMLVAPYAIYPAEVPPSTITVPYSAIEAALIGINDTRTGNPNSPAAGVNGISRMALGLDMDYTDVEREELNEAGVTMAKIRYGEVRTYGYRTAAGPQEQNWLWFGNSRVVMALSHECDAVAEKYVLQQIDGRRQIFAKLEADLRGVCKRYFDLDALYGADPEEAFTVDTGPTLNTIDTIRRGELHAIVKVKCSPAAEWVVIEIVKVPVERAL